MRSPSYLLRIAPLPGAALFAAGLLAGALIVPSMAQRSDDRAPSADDRPALPNPRAPIAGGYQADVLRVLDGDTFEARVRIWPGLEMTTRVRLRSIDAPELKAKCAEERTKAEAARDALTAILAEGEVTILRVGLDKYGGRVDADAATRKTPDVGAAMLAKGLARAYDGGRRQSWCAGL